MTEFIEALAAAAGPERTHPDALLAPLTTFKVGGRADVLVEVTDAEQMAAVVRLAHAAGVPVTVIGGGSNLLVSDDGVRGVVMRPRSGVVRMSGEGLVRAGAAVTINGLVRWTIARALSGLEAWAGTPGTVGGAIHGNAHWRQTNIGDLVTSVGLVRPDGTLLQVPAEGMEFGYDHSRLQHTREIVAWAEFRVAPGADSDELRTRARASLAYRKRTQPLALPSAGCVFQNPDPARDPLPPGVPASAGALIDRAGLKGRAVGGASISTIHANFIVNDGTATAADIDALVALCHATVMERFGVTLREEIARLGRF